MKKLLILVGTLLMMVNAFASHPTCAPKKKSHNLEQLGSALKSSKPLPKPNKELTMVYAGEDISHRLTTANTTTA